MPFSLARADLDDARGVVELLAGRQEGGAVGERPGVILDVGDLEPARAQRQRHVDHLGHAAQVLPMDHHVHRERQTGGAHGRCEAGLPGMCAGQPRDAVIVGGREILKAELDVLQPGGGKGCDFLFTAQRARGDEIAVETVLARGGDQRQEIAPRHRLAAREMHLQDAERCRFGQHAAPFRFAELAGRPFELYRVGAIRAAQRTAMGELGQQRQGRINARRHRPDIPCPRDPAAWP